MKIFLFISLSTYFLLLFFLILTQDPRALNLFAVGLALASAWSLLNVGRIIREIPNLYRYLYNQGPVIPSASQSREFQTKFLPLIKIGIIVGACSNILISGLMLAGIISLNF